MPKRNTERAPVFHIASWTSLDTGVVSFRKDWESKKLPVLRWGPDELPLRALERAPLSDYGNASGYFIKGGELHFVLRADRYADLDPGADGLYVAGDFNGWEAAIGDARWQLRPTELDGVAYFGLEVKLEAVDPAAAPCFKFVTGRGIWLDVPGNAPNLAVDAHHNRNFRIRSERTGRHRFFFRTPLPLNRSPEPYLVFLDGHYRERIRLQPGVFLKTLAATGPLGAIVEDERTVFHLFAPRASGVMLHLFERLEDAEACRPLAMVQTEDLVWEARVSGNRAGWFYYYRIAGDDQDGYCYFDEKFPVLDPYALACVGPRGPGIVVDQRRLPRTERAFVPPKWHDLVIVEAHLRDLIACAPMELGAEERLGFNGLTKWIRERGCYLRELGANAVELQPIHEFDTADPEEYGWGYMPVNYFAPASQYASEPERGVQIGEFRAVVDAFHEAGLAVIIDVVYNHVGVPNYLQYIDKEYYFQLDPDGEYLNWSGCGNTIDPDTAMSRRLMRDSLVHYLKTFDVDGFRFDLGELLGIDCLRYLEEEVKKVKPSAFLVAEPWSFRAHIADRFKEINVAFWHDGFREYVREYLTGAVGADRLAYFMMGSRHDLAAFPAQVVNYVSSHDDRVWIDKITENRRFDGSLPTPNDRRRTHLMAAILMLSAGVPMLHAGTDFLFSKGGRNNTYLDGDTNALRYDRLRYFSGTHEYFRRLIALRGSEWGRLLRLDGHPPRDYFEWTSDERAFALCYNANRRGSSAQLVFAVNPTFETRSLRFPGVHWAEWRQIADHERVDESGLPSACFVFREDVLELPPLGCGIWVRS